MASVNTCTQLMHAQSLCNWLEAENLGQDLIRSILSISKVYSAHYPQKLVHPCDDSKIHISPLFAGLRRACIIGVSRLDTLSASVKIFIQKLYTSGNEIVSLGDNIGGVVRLTQCGSRSPSSSSLRVL
jgi:hypothetical protein